MHLYGPAAEVEVAQLGQRVVQLEPEWHCPDFQSPQLSLHWEWWPQRYY